jgi:uncharacterized protein YjbJ (UPF0337 family)
MAVNQETLEGNWKEIKGKIRDKWGEVSNDDLQRVRGNFDQLVGMIQRKTGEARQQVEEYLDELTGGARGAFGKMASAVRDYASQAADSAGDVAERARDYVRGGYEQTEQLIQQRPLESLAVGFGTGLITGVVIGLMIRPR